MSEYDAVNHPKHYTDGKYECIDFIESWGLGFHLGNAVKYITRAGKKDPQKTKEDLEKALWYLKRARDYDKPRMYYSSPVMGCGIADRTSAKDDRIGVHDYMVDKKLSYALSQTLLRIVRDDIEGALINLQAAIMFREE